MTATHELPSRTVLGIDNNELTLQMLKEVCDMKNIRTLVARSIEGAEKVIAKNPLPDLIILNLHLEHEEHGLPFLQKLKSPDSRYKDIPVIVFTSDSRPEMEQTCRMAGAAGFITKPADIDIIINEIDKVLGNKTKI